MWKKILPIAAVLILGWIGLNLITGGDDDQQETVAEATDAEPATEQSAAGTDDSDSTTDAEQASTDETTEASESESAEVAATDDETDASESSEETDTESETTDATAETDTDAESTDATAEADAESTDAAAEADAESTDATAEADTESTDATAEADAESTDATAEADTESDTAETAESDTESDASASAEAETSESADSSTVVMRYPTDPETGLTLYDQGMVETVVEPAAGDEAAESSDSEEASTDDGSAEPVEGTLEMRYPIDPVTGLSLLDQEMVEVLVEPSNYEASDETETAAVEVAQEEATGADDTESEATVEAAEESTEPTGPRYPTDPVTGLSIYDQGMIGEVQTEATEEAEQAESDEGRLPVDPVTGATIFETAEAGADDSSESTTSETSSSVSFTATASERANFDLGGISRQLGKTFGITSLVLERSVDEESAKAALPQLQATSSDLGNIADQISELPDAARSPLNGVISSGMSKLKPLVDTTMTREGVGPVLGEVITPMLETLEGLSQ